MYASNVVIVACLQFAQVQYFMCARVCVYMFLFNGCKKD